MSGGRTVVNLFAPQRHVRLPALRDGEGWFLDLPGGVRMAVRCWHDGPTTTLDVTLSGADLDTRYRQDVHIPAR